MPLNKAINPGTQQQKTYVDVDENRGARAVTFTDQYEILADAAAVAADGQVNTSFTAPFHTATVLLNVSAATTITVFVQSQSGVYYQYTTWAAAGAATNAISVTSPGYNIQVQSSAPINWTVEVTAM